jgi:hypothetical protein
LASSSGLRGHKRTYLTILELADHALFKMVRYVLLRPLRPELDAKTKTCLAAKTRFCHLDEQALCLLRAEVKLSSSVDVIRRKNGVNAIKTVYHVAK